MTLTAKDIREFTAYLQNCSDNQVRGVYRKERDADRDAYVALAGRSIDKQAIAQGLHSHDGGTTWHRGH